jgi:hypothetical protein
MLAARPLVALPDGTVVAGNMRLRAARLLGWETVPTVYADLDETQARLWLLRDNNEYGEWQEDALGELLAQLSHEQADLDLTGFPPDELERLIAELGGGAGEDGLDDATRLAVAQATLGEPRHSVERGERWRLGDRHTLVVASPYDEHARWGWLLPGHDLFLPFPTPMLALSERAERDRLLLVQPSEYLAGHLLDRYEDHHGAGSVERVDAA